MKNKLQGEELLLHSDLETGRVCIVHLLEYPE